MLQFLRKSITSWVGIVILAIALGALVITLFQPTGPGGGTSASGPVVATVSEAAVTEAEFLRTIERAVDRERERQPAITNADFVNAGGGELVLEQMIGAKAITEFGTANGMVVSKQMIDGEIASIPAFQVNGKFDEPTFRRLLQQQRLTEAEVRDSIAADLKRRQLLQPVAMATTVPRGLAEPYAALLLEVRRGQIIAVPAAAMPEPGAPTPAQLAAFHKANAQAFTIPERRAFRYALVTPALVADRAKPTEAEIAKAYQDRIAEFGGAETRTVNFVVLPTRAEADAFVKAAAGGPGFSEAAKGAGFAPTDYALGAMDRSSLEDRTNAQVATAAFGLAKPGIAAPVETPLGFYVVQVTGITPAAPRPLASVRAELEQRLIDEKVETLMAETVNAAEERLSGGEAFADVAKSLGLAVESVPAVTADGRTFDEDLAVARADNPITPKVFAADEADGPQVADIGEGRFALFEIAETIPPYLVPVDRIRDDVTLAWTMDTRQKAAKATADRIAAALGKGEALAAATRGLALPPPQPLQIRRLELTQMAQQGTQVPPPVLLMLSTPSGQARVLAAPGAQGWFVVKVDAVEPGSLAQAPQLADAVRQSFTQQAGEEMAATFVRAIEREVGVVRNPAAITAAKRRVTGAGLE
jgi:peptidyl-prolyl cis-trans isomerase D